jgi:hypothetical protein
MGEDFEAVEDGHPDIEQEEVGGMGADSRQGFGTVTSFEYVVPGAAQAFGVEGAEVGFIFRDDDGCRHFVTSTGTAEFSSLWSANLGCQ